MIAATHRDLRREAEAGRFRSDLYYRLSVFPIEVPPLRERSEDVPVLAEAFLASASRRLGRKPPRLTRAVVQRLQRYAWPGNVRELQHVIERGVLTSPGAALEVELPGITHAHASSRSAPDVAAPVRTAADLRQLEIDNLRAALLGLRPTTLASRMKALDLDNLSLRRGAERRD